MPYLILVSILLVAGKTGVEMEWVAKVTEISKGIVHSRQVHLIWNLTMLCTAHCTSEFNSSKRNDAVHLPGVYQSYIRLRAFFVCIVQFNSQAHFSRLFFLTLTTVPHFCWTDVILLSDVAKAPSFVSGDPGDRSYDWDLHLITAGSWSYLWHVLALAFSFAKWKCRSEDPHVSFLSLKFSLKPLIFLGYFKRSFCILL